MDWREAALAAISEGACPNHGGPGHQVWLGEHRRRAGWCGSCRIWWRADAATGTVHAHYDTADLGE